MTLKQQKEYLWVRVTLLILLTIAVRALEMCVHFMEGGRGRGKGGGRADPDKSRSQGSYSSQVTSSRSQQK